MCVYVCVCICIYTRAHTYIYVFPIGSVSLANPNTTAIPQYLVQYLALVPNYC